MIQTPEHLLPFHVALNPEDVSEYTHRLTSATLEELEKRDKRDLNLCMILEEDSVAETRTITRNELRRIFQTAAIEPILQSTERHLGPDVHIEKFDDTRYKFASNKAEVTVEEQKLRRIKTSHKIILEASKKELRETTKIILKALYGQYFGITIQDLKEILTRSGFPRADITRNIKEINEEVLAETDVQLIIRNHLLIIGQRDGAILIPKSLDDTEGDHLDEVRAETGIILSSMERETIIKKLLQYLFAQPNFQISRQDFEEWYTRTFKQPQSKAPGALSTVRVYLENNTNLTLVSDPTAQSKSDSKSNDIVKIRMAPSSVKEEPEGKDLVDSKSINSPKTALDTLVDDPEPEPAPEPTPTPTPIPPPVFLVGQPSQGEQPPPQAILDSIADMGEAVATLETQLGILKKQLTEAGVTIDQLRLKSTQKDLKIMEKDQALTQLREELAKLEESLELLIQNGISTNEETLTLSQSLKEANAFVDSLLEDLARNNETTQQLQQQLAENTQNLELDSKIQELEQRIAKLEQTIHQLNQELEKSQETVTSSRKVIHEQKKTIEERDSLVGQLKGRLRELEATLDAKTKPQPDPELTKKVDELEQTIKQLKQQLVERTKELEEMKKHALRNKDAADLATRIGEAIGDDKQRLQQELLQTRQRLEEAEKALAAKRIAIANTAEIIHTFHDREHLIADSLGEIKTQEALATTILKVKNQYLKPKTVTLEKRTVCLILLETQAISEKTTRPALQKQLTEIIESLYLMIYGNRNAAYIDAKDIEYLAGTLTLEGCDSLEPLNGEGDEKDDDSKDLDDGDGDGNGEDDEDGAPESPRKPAPKRQPPKKPGKPESAQTSYQVDTMHALASTVEKILEPLRTQGTIKPSQAIKIINEFGTITTAQPTVLRALNAFRTACSRIKSRLEGIPRDGDRKEHDIPIDFVKPLLQYRF